MKTLLNVIAAFVLITLLSVQVTHAQHKHQFQLELGGSSLFYSVGYAYYLTPDFSIGVGFGTAYFNLSDSDDSDPDMSPPPDSFIDYKNIPITFTYLTGGERNKLELYTGFSVMKLDISLLGLEIDMDNWQLVPAAGVGYRYQRKNWYGGVSIGVIVLSSSPALLSDLELAPVIPNWGLRTGFRF